MKETVCAVVVTYNRKNLLIECLEALRKQIRPLDAIYIIDNASTDGTQEFLKENGYIGELPPSNLSEPWEKEFEIENLVDGKPIKIHYVRMHGNTGGAGGFYEGVKRGYEKGYNWLWLMDDDVFPKDDCLKELLEAYNSSIFPFYLLQPVRYYGNRYVVTGGKVLDFKNPFLRHIHHLVTLSEIEKANYSPIVIEGVCFEGILINKKVIEEVGYPRGDFFIGGDETDYSARLIQRSFKTLLVPRATIFRQLDLSVKTKKNLQGYWWYYFVRNTVAIDRTYGNVWVRNLRPLFRLLRSLLQCVLVGHGFLEIKLIFEGFFDGIKNRLGKKY